MKYIAIIFALLFSISLSSQPENGWKIFEKTEFEKTFAKDYGMFITWPKFTDEIKAWDGKEVMLAGYIIPTADAAGFEGVIISKYPYSMCFFCGEAGIESVAELRFKKEPPDFDLDKTYVFKGKLKLNDSDFDELNFILLEVELMDL